MNIPNINISQDVLPVARRIGNDFPAVVAAASIKIKEAVPTEQLIRPQPAAEQLKNAVNDINIAFRQSNQNLEFSFDPSTDKLIVRMKDTETGELILQFPSEATLAIARSIDQFQQFQQGLLLKEKA